MLLMRRINVVVQCMRVSSLKDLFLIVEGLARPYSTSIKRSARIKEMRLRTTMEDRKNDRGYSQSIVRRRYIKLIPGKRGLERADRGSRHEGNSEEPRDWWTAQSRSDSAAKLGRCVMAPFNRCT